jgi:Nucleoside 2-deoxyribosyltransferase
MPRIYVAHRLFALHDRILGARIADSLAQRFGEDNVFLPYCDSRQQTLVSDIKGKEIYRRDVSQLADTDIVVCALHGPSLDDGVCVELGYAYGAGIPVVAITTDFETFSQKPFGAQTILADPLIEVVCESLVRVHEAKLVGEHGKGLYRDYISRHEAAVWEAIESATDAVAKIAEALPGTAAERAPRLGDPSPAVYVESSPYYARTPLHDVWNGLADRGIEVRGPARFDYSDAPYEFARQDLLQALACRTLVLDASGPEAPPGASLLLGAALALGRHRVVYTGRPRYTHAPGFEPNARNLMVLYGADMLAHDTDDIVHHVSSL